jgi:AGZA family xanthine/uracil permease-like MFS transporter
LLGSLAAIAIALIAFVPLMLNVAALPLVGFLSLIIILVTLLAHRGLPGKIPGALAAVLAGIVAYWACSKLGKTFGWPLIPDRLPHGAGGTAAAGEGDWPWLVWDAGWWTHVLSGALAKLPIALPFALATVVGGIDCTESAAAAGDEFDTRTIVVTEGLASVAAGLFGGVIQNTPYIGHPAYKAMGGRAAYTLATALFIGAAGFFGWFARLFDLLPEAAMFPILIYVGLEITSQSFRATPARHFPALGIAMLPALAYLATIPLDMALAGRAPDAAAAGVVQTLRCLANGFIVTSLLWAASLASLLDAKLVRSALYLVVAALCSLFGIIHSPFAQSLIALPTSVMRDLPATATYQTPYHWAGAYLLMAGVLAVLAVLPSKEGESKQS